MRGGRSSRAAEARRPLREVGEFRAVFLLLISLLHGVLFFILADRLVELLNGFSLDQVSLFILFATLFFRVLQTQLLAALKYDGSWQIKPYDFIIVFVAILIEYLIFQHELVALSRDLFLRAMLAVFAGFGVIGYVLTYVRTRSALSHAEDRRREKIVQSTNIIVVVLLGTISLFDLFFRPFPQFFWIANFFIAITLWVNMYVSIRLSRVVL